MREIMHIKIPVDSDMRKEEQKEEMLLVDFACDKLNSRLEELADRNPRVVSISESYWTEEIRPRMDNSATWYKQQNFRLSVYIELDHVESDS